MRFGKRRRYTSNVPVPFVGRGHSCFPRPRGNTNGPRIDVRLKHEAAVARDEAIHIAESHLLLGLCIPSAVGVIRVL